MSATAPPAAKRGFPTGAKVLIALFAAVVLVAIAVAVFAGRSSQNVSPPQGTPLLPAPSNSLTGPPSAPATISPAPSSTVVDSNVANGCLGGDQSSDNLTQAALAAQKSAPITPVGAAEFTATLMRWATTAPAPPGQAQFAQDLLTPTATASAHMSLSSSVAAEQAGYTVGLSFAGGHYIVSAFGGDTATVEWEGTGSATHNGVAQGTGQLGGTVTLDGHSGAWKMQNSSGRAGVAVAAQQMFLETLAQTGTQYAGGC